MTDAATLNLNAMSCLKEISNIGNTTYQNVCTGGTTVVPWGTADWFGFWLCAGFAGALVLCGLVLSVALYRN